MKNLFLYRFKSFFLSFIFTSCLKVFNFIKGFFLLFDFVGLHMEKTAKEIKDESHKNLVSTLPEKLINTDDFILTKIA